MKKSIDKILLILIVVILLGVLIVATKRSDSRDPILVPTTSIYDVSSFNEIKPSDIDKFEKNQIYVIFIGCDKSSLSRDMIPVYRDIQNEYGYVTQYIDILNVIDLYGNKIVNEDELNYLKNMKKVQEQSKVFDEIGRTPLTLFVKNREIIDSYLGYADYDTFISILNRVGLEKK